VDRPLGASIKRVASASAEGQEDVPAIHHVHIDRTGGPVRDGNAWSGGRPLVIIGRSAERPSEDRRHRANVLAAHVLCRTYLR